MSGVFEENMSEELNDDAKADEYLCPTCSEDGCSEIINESETSSQIHLNKTHVLDNCFCCGSQCRGVLRYAIRNRVEILLNIKTATCLLEMGFMIIIIAGTDITISVTNWIDMGCVGVNLFLMGWLMRIPIELAVTQEYLVNRPQDFPLGIWIVIFIWDFGFFIYGHALSIEDLCVHEPSTYVGLRLILATSYLCCFTNFPPVAAMVESYLSNMNPILPYLPHCTYEEFEKKYPEKIKGEKDDQFCIICFEVYKKKNIITRMPCNHFYHQYCINQWLKDHNTCPQCRSIIPDWESMSEESEQNEQINEGIRALEQEFDNFDISFIPEAEHL